MEFFSSIGCLGSFTCVRVKHEVLGDIDSKARLQARTHAATHAPQSTGNERKKRRRKKKKKRKKVKNKSKTRIKEYKVELVFCSCLFGF